ncbi:hypothetical protein O9992_00940 [Vibrio lentus]|nr:hypothetical protein [Vibrio lentus]
MTLKPQFRVGYKADFGLTTALRYRHANSKKLHRQFKQFSPQKVNGDKNSISW